MLPNVIGCPYPIVIVAPSYPPPVHYLPSGLFMALKPIQERAILLLLTAKSQSAVAKELGVDAVTIRRWLRSPTFLNELRKAQRDLFSESLRELLNSTTAAILCLAKLLESEDEEVQHRAAKTLLDYAHPAFIGLESIAEVTIKELEHEGRDTESDGS